jgi:NADPH:quinone reductase-like Zn-dependent oxidoreductase
MVTMRAIRIHGYGGPEVLRYEDVPRPVPGEGEVLVRVAAAAVNPLDWKVRSGRSPLWPPHTFPLILGFDVAGVVEAVGTGVTGFAVGDEVFGSPDMGGYAEYAIVPAARLAHKPHTLDAVQAAALPVAGLTAWQALFDTAHLQAGQTILIHGAAGGVGHLAVQLAKWRGAAVIGTASSRNLDFLHRLGADEVVDYTTTRFEEVAHAVDVVLDIVGGETFRRSWAVLRPGGILVSLNTPPSFEPAAAQGVQLCELGVELEAESELAELARLADAGHIKPEIATVLPLADVRQAHVLSESRHVRGKIVLRVRP